MSRNGRKLKVAIVLPGRFHGFDLACALLDRGHDVTVFTNYPPRAAARFGLPRERVRSHRLHGVLLRLLAPRRRGRLAEVLDAWLHPLFGRWAQRRLARETWDVIHVWSGVAEEELRVPAAPGTLRFLMRGSAHIDVQARLLEEEARRTGCAQDRPTRWMIERENREYAMANRLIVLSTFARDSFLARGEGPERLHLLPLGSAVESFRPRPATVDARRRRIEAGEPLRVLFVGTLSFQKGLWDLAYVVRRLAGDRFRFRLVGGCSPEARLLVADLAAQAEVAGRVPQQRLPDEYDWADLFLFPTIHDGFAVVLAQAAAAALPILASENSSAPDLIQPGENGWVLPIRAPHLFVERLEWCDAHRAELAAMVQRVYEQFEPRDWSAVARDFEALCHDAFEERRAPAMGRSSGG